MKILQINGVIHRGSTGDIIDAIKDYLVRKHADCQIAYGIGKKVDDGLKFCYRYEQALYRRCSMITGLRYGFAPISTLRLKKQIKAYQPDIVHLHSINGNIVNIHKLLIYLKSNHIPTVITHHAEFFYTGNCTSTHGCDMYVDGCRNCQNLKFATDSSLFPTTHRAWKKMKNAFEGFDNITIVSVSDYTERCSKRSPILQAYEHKVILNGIDTNMFKPTYSIDIRKNFNLSNAKIGIFVTSAFSTEKDHLKGGYWLLKLAEMLSKDNFQFLVVGSDGKNINADNVHFIGRISDKELLANLYSQADIALMFSKSESFGLTCVEALCCGIPVAGFLCGGTENVAIPQYTRFSEYGDMQTMIKNIEELTDRYSNKNSEISQTAREMYSRDKMAAKYHSLYESILRNRVKK